ncbi:magnesium ion transporter, partial [Coemansia sp. RSA 2424]
MNVALLRRSIAFAPPRQALLLRLSSPRALSFNMFDLLPDLEKLKTRRSRSLKDAVDKGMVDQGFVSGFEHLTRPLNSKGKPKPEHPPTGPLNQEVYRYPRSNSSSSSSDSSLMTDLRLRCTELDKDGNVTVRAGEFQKSDLCAQHGLLPRDLRKIDSKF